MGIPGRSRLFPSLGYPSMTSAPRPRRSDLDALRAAAMLLGILLHAGLSFVPFPWPVQDERQSGFYWFLFAAIHGFRMPVFFLLSGFFTAMLWRRRGMKSMLTHRFRRVLLPFLLGLVTIVPAVNWISGRAVASGFEANAGKGRERQHLERRPERGPRRHGTAPAGRGGCRRNGSGIRADAPGVGGPGRPDGSRRLASAERGRGQRPHKGRGNAPAREPLSWDVRRPPGCCFGTGRIPGRGTTTAIRPEGP